MGKKLQIKESEIVDQYEGCVYCYEPKDDSNWRGCCGEVHYDEIVVTEDEAHLLDEVEIVEDEYFTKGSDEAYDAIKDEE